MKIILPGILFSLVSVVAGCQSVHSVKFTTGTRGYNKEVEISPKTISLMEQNFTAGGKEKNITWEIRKDEWRKIIESLNGVMLREIPLLKAPSNKRAYDGARASTLTITDKKGELWYHAFDDDMPHEALVPLLKTINELTTGK
jgi:hypothetical protein